MVRPRRILHHLLNPRLVDLKLAVFIQHKLLVRLLEIRHHLDFVSRPPVVNRALLRIGFIHHFLILVKDKIGLRGLKADGRCVHFLEDALQARSFRLLRRPKRVRQHKPKDADAQKNFSHYCLFTQTR